MTEMTTHWLGLTLRSPLVVAASPLCDDTDTLQQLVKAGAGAVIMRSLFEEQIILEQMAAHRFIDSRVDTNAEARSFLPDKHMFAIGIDPYLAQLQHLKKTLDVPVIASLNGATPGGWTDLATQLEQAGASAIELNLYQVCTHPEESGVDVEERQIETVRAVVASVQIPVNVKISPFHASVPAFARRLAMAGASGLTVFNRFYQPDILLDTLDVDTRLHFSTPTELPLRLHALAILHGRVSLSLSATGGVHNGLDAAKAILCGADVIQMASALLQHGVEAMATTHQQLILWLHEKGYQSVNEARGLMSLENTPDPEVWERLNYMRVLQGWKSRRTPF